MTDFSTTLPLRRARPSLLARLVFMMDVAKSRRALNQLDAGQLEDVGLSTKEADGEVARGFWDVPATWRK